jgi:hypothetical protein
MLIKWCLGSGLLIAFAGLLLLLVSSGPATIGVIEARSSSNVSSSSEPAIQPCAPATTFDAANFSNPTRIDSKWLPLVPGKQLVLDGQANRGAGLLPHRVVFTVTDATKVINGVKTIVVWDRDINDGQLEEAELAFFAQDDAGNVWNLGEYPELYEEGRFIGAPDTWIAGVNRAQAGIHMLTTPGNGTSYYLQGYAPDIGFLDCAKVFKTGEQTCVPANCYADVLVTDEISPLDQGGGHQRKFHAPGVGIVRIGAVGDPEGETLALTSVVNLSSRGLAEAHAEALKLDKHAYRVSDVYRQTQPAH